VLAVHVLNDYVFPVVAFERLDIFLDDCAILYFFSSNYCRLSKLFISLRRSTAQDVSVAFIRVVTTVQDLSVACMYSSVVSEVVQVVRSCFRGNRFRVGGWGRWQGHPRSVCFVRAIFSESTEIGYNLSFICRISWSENRKTPVIKQRV
jgi:hypothetical protein